MKPTAENIEPRVWGEYRAHECWSYQNSVNACLCLFALAPSVAATVVMYSQCEPQQDSFTDTWDTACTLALSYPIAMANVLFFINVSVGFWIVGLIQQNFWLIDPYWTLIPPLLAHFYQLNPLATSNPIRSVVSLVLIWVWSARLTFSYFRREEWKFGQQEDWRYTKMAKENPSIWWLLSFLAVGVAQQPMLIGISLPAFSVHRSPAALNALDGLALALCIAGLTVAYVADSQLYEYMQARKVKGSPASAKLVLDSGLWRYSRHPNYFGETLWWFGYGLFACSVGQWYMLGGWLLNTAVLLQVTCMTEGRMLENRTGERLKAFEHYRATTSCWIPWFPSVSQVNDADVPILNDKAAQC